MSARALVRAVTVAAIGVIVIGLGLVVLPFAAPEPDPVLIDNAHAAGRSARIDLSVMRRGRLTVEIRTQDGAPLRVLLPEQAVAPGSLSVSWDGRLDSGVAAPPAEYVLRATAYPGVRPFVVERRLQVGA